MQNGLVVYKGLIGMLREFTAGNFSGGLANIILVLIGAPFTMAAWLGLKYLIELLSDVFRRSKH